MIELERQLITRMCIGDLEIAKGMLEIGNLERAKAALDSAVNKIKQLEALLGQSPRVPDQLSAIDV